LYLAVDLGTQGPKVAAIGDDGAILARSFVHVATQWGDAGLVTQDANAWWTGIASQVREMRGVMGEHEVRAVAITGQYGSTVPVDSAGDASGPCLLWPTRSPRQATHGAIGPNGHERVLRSDLGEIDRRTTLLLEPVDYLGLRFTGVARATPASMFAARLIPLESDTSEPSYAPELIDKEGRDPRRLPQLIPTGSTLGTVSPEAASELAIAADIPVVAGIPDLHTAYLGSGALELGRAHQVLSSTSWMGLSVERPHRDAARQIATVPGIRPGHLLIENSQRAAGIALDWLVNLLHDQTAAPARDAHRAIDAAAAGVPVGARGVMFAPWLNGERTPLNDNRLRGGLVGLTPTSGRAEIARAVLEGIAFNSRLLRDSIRGLTGLALDELTLIGRCSELDSLCQISADVLAVPIDRVAEPSLANLRGAAMFGALAIGRVTLEEAAGWVRVERTFTPDPGAAAMYDDLFPRFRELSSQPAFRRLA
jgi:xylulokinase